MSWRFEVHTSGDPPDYYSSNAMRFATEAEAQAYGLNLGSRWTAVEDGRTREIEGEPNYKWRADLSKAVPIIRSANPELPPKGDIDF